MRISDRSSDVCSSDLNSGAIWGAGAGITTSYLYDEEIGQLVGLAVGTTVENRGKIGSASCRESVVRVDLGGRRIIKKNTTATTNTRPPPHTPPPTSPTPHHTTPPTPPHHHPPP